MSAIKIFIDFGSTFTKAVAVDVDRIELISSVQVSSTVEKDITIGLKNALNQVTADTKVTDIEKQDILACSSARGGLRIVSIGFVAELSSKAATQTALGAGAKVVGHYSYELNQQELSEIERIAPDIILLAGGTDGGDKKVIIHNARMLEGDNLPGSHIIVAGNKAAHDEIRKIFSGSNKLLTFTKNVMPEIGKLDTGPCNEQVREIFIKSIVEAKGIGKARTIVKDVIMPTPSAVLDAARLLAEGYGSDRGLGELIVVDPGGATTDIHSISQGKPTKGNVILRGLPEPYIKRTVEGDLGVRYNISTLLELLKIRQKAQDSDPIINPGKIPSIEHLPETDQEYAFDKRLASISVEVAMERHAGIIEQVYGPAGEMYVQHGKDLTEIECVIGTGGPIIFSQDPKSILQKVVFQEENPYILRPKHPAFYVDEYYIMFGAGLLAQSNPASALALMKKYLKKL